MPPNVNLWLNSNVLQWSCKLFIYHAATAWYLQNEVFVKTDLFCLSYTGRTQQNAGQVQLAASRSGESLCSESHLPATFPTNSDDTLAGFLAPVFGQCVMALRTVRGERERERDHIRCDQ